MRHLRITGLLATVLGLLGVLSLAGLSSCGGSDTVSRETATVTPIVVLTVENGGEDGADLGGLNSDGSPADGGLVISWPVNLKAQVFLPSDSTFGDGDPIVGDLITHVGKIHFESSEDGETWVAFQSDVSITGTGYATYNNFQGLDGCPDINYLRAHFTPSTTKGGPKKGNGNDICQAGSDTYQTFTMGTTDSPFVDVWVEVEGDYQEGYYDGEPPLTQYHLNFDGNQPSWLPGTRAVDGEVIPLSFTLYVKLRGVHNYTLYGKTHISEEDGEITEGDFAFEGDDFELPMNVTSCSLPQTFSMSFDGFTPTGQGPIISHLFIGGSTWEIGDPHSSTLPPPGHAPEPAPTPPPPQ